MSDDLFAPPSKEELAQAKPPEQDLFAPPSKDELAAAAPPKQPSMMAKLGALAAEHPTIADALTIGPGGVFLKRAAQNVSDELHQTGQYAPPAGPPAAKVTDSEMQLAGQQQAQGAPPAPLPTVLTAPFKAAEGAPALAKIGAALGNSAVRVGTNAGLMAANAASEGKDPKDAASRGAVLGGLVEAPILGLQGLGALAQSPAVQSGAKKVVSAVGGVSEGNISRYLEDPEAIRAAQKIPLADIKDMVDTDLARIGAGVEDAELAHSGALARRDDLGNQLGDAFDNARAKIGGKVADAKDALKGAYMEALQELRDEAVPLDMAKRLSGSLASEKAALGSLSDQADEALARTPGAVARDDLRGLLRNVAGEIGAAGANGERHLIGDEAIQSVGRLHELDQRLAALPDQVPFQTARDIMRQVRADVRNSGGYGMGSGEFNGTLNNARKAFVGRLSDYLKEQSPEYAAHMQEMQPRSQSLERMNELFGDSDRALTSLTAATGAGPKAQIVQDVLQNHAQLTGNAQPLQELQRYADARRILNTPALRQQLMEALPEYRQLQRAQTALEKFAPEKTGAATQLMIGASPAQADLGQAEANLADARALRGQFPGWTPMSTENRLKTAMANTQNPDRGIETGRTLDALSAFNGQNDYRQMLADKATGNAFQGTFQHGSRNVNLWAMIGSLVGHVPGGAMVGAAIDRFGPKATQVGLDGYIGLKNALGPFATTLLEAAQRGPQSLAVTHYLLMQQSPDYQRRVGGQDQKGDAP